MRVLICANTREISNGKLVEIMNRLPKNCLEYCEINNKGSSYFRIKNGNEYYSIISEESIGSRFHKIYIHKNVDDKFVSRVLLPMLCYSKLVDDCDRVVYFD